MRVFSTRAVEWGFFLPPDHDAFSTEAISEALLAPRGHARVPLAGLTGELHFARLGLVERGETTTTEHLVLSAHHPRLTDSAIRSLTVLLRAYAPGTALSFLIEDVEGWARVVPDVLTPQAAAAVAIVKYNGSWDGSDPIFVESDDHAFAVEMSFAEETWTATVAPTSTPARSPRH